MIVVRLIDFVLSFQVDDRNTQEKQGKSSLMGALFAYLSHSIFKVF
jgi:hypothetical protein